tara:strand:+ start:444 stop:3854 length:3411 start_codon:yes stop_codon:yes gene_type:complete
MWFDTIKKKEKFPDIPDGKGGTRKVSLDDRFGRGRKVIRPKTKRKDRKSRSGVEGLYDYISENNGLAYDDDFSNAEWDSSIKELEEIVKDYNINIKGNTIPNLNILETIKSDSGKRKYEEAISRLDKGQKKALIDKIKENFVKEDSRQSFSESAKDRYNLLWRTSKDSVKNMNYNLGTMFTEIKEGTGDKGSVMSSDISKPYTKEFEEYLAKTFGSNLSRSLTDVAFKTLLADIKEAMSSSDVKEESGKPEPYEQFLDDKGKLKKAQISGMMKYKPISLLDEEGYVFENKHKTKIKEWYKEIKDLKNYFITRESKSYTDEYKKEVAKGSDGKYKFVGSKKKIVRKKEVIYGGILVETETGLPVLDKDINKKMEDLQKESPMETLFKGDKKQKNTALGLAKMYAILYGDELDLQKTGIKSVKRTGLIKNLLEKSKSKKDKETDTKRTVEQEIYIFQEILKEAAKGKFKLASEDENKEMLRLLAPKFEDYLGGLRNNLNNGFKTQILPKSPKFPFKSSDYGNLEEGGELTIVLLQKVFNHLNIRFNIEKLTDKDVKNTLEVLNFDFGAFTEKMILAYDDNENNIMNILESGRPSVDDEKLSRDVKLDLFFNDKYKKQRINAIYEIYMQIDELEEDLNDNEITLDDEKIDDVNTIVRMLSLLYAIALNDDMQLDPSAEDDFDEALEIIIKKSKGKVKSLGSDIDVEKVKRLKEMFEGLDLDRERFKQEKQRDNEQEIDEDDLGEMIEDTKELISNFILNVVYDVEYTYLKTTSTMSEEDRKRLFGSKKNKQLKKSYPLPEHIKRKIEQDVKNMPEKTEKQQEEKKKKKQDLAMQYYNGTYPQRITEAEKERRRKEFDSGEDISDKEMEDWRKTLRNKKSPSYEVTPRENPIEPKRVFGAAEREPTAMTEEESRAKRIPITPSELKEKTEEVTEKERIQVEVPYYILELSNENLITATTMYNQSLYQKQILPKIQELLVKKHYSGEKSGEKYPNSFLDASGKLKIPLEKTPLKITLTNVKRQSSFKNTPLYKDIRKAELKLNALDKNLDSAKDEVSKLMNVTLRYLLFLTKQLPNEFKPPKLNGIAELLNKYPMTEEEYKASLKLTKKQMKIANEWVKQSLTTSTKKKGKILTLYTTDFN